jgi:RNA polymerase sigma-70 factor, ECF subfamily
VTGFADPPEHPDRPDVAPPPSPTAAARPRRPVGIREGDGIRTPSGMWNEQWSDASDATIVVAIGRYRQEALAEAYRRHAGSVMGLAMRLLRARNLAEEVTQEVFLRLWNQPEKFDPERGSLRSYLLAQTHGRSVDLLRSESSRRAREEREVRATAESGYDLEHEVLDLTTGQHIREALTALAHDERQAIELAYFGGHTYREVAAMLGIPEGTIKSRIRTGLRRLRENLVASGALA